VVGFQWGLDVPPTTTIVPIGAGGSVSVPVTPTTVGRHELNVRTVDRAGNFSPVDTTYAFRVGSAGILGPKDGTRVVRRVRLTVASDLADASVRFEWRRGPDSPPADVWDVPVGHLSTSNGTPWTSRWQALPAVNGYTTWDAGATLGFAGGPVQVRAEVQEPGNPVTHLTQWVTLTVDPDAQGAASTGVGPGSVNLLTGDYVLSATDVEEFGLAVVRTSSSRDPDAGYQLQPDKLTPAQQQTTATTGSFNAFSVTLGLSTTTFHTGSADKTGLALTPSTTGSDSFAAIGGDTGAMRLGLQAGRTYRFSGWVFVPSTGTTMPTPAGACGLKMALFTRVGTGSYSSPCGSTAASSVRPTVVNAWQQVTFDATIPAGATEAFVRLYDGFNAASGQVVYWDDLSVRELWSPLGPQWSTGVVDGASGTAYTRISRPYPDVAALEFAGGGDLWFTTGDGVTWWPEAGGEGLALTHPTPTTWTVTDLEGTVTQFAQSAGSTSFDVVSTSAPSAAGATRYVYESVAGISRLLRMIAPVEPGVDPSAPPGTACTGDLSLASAKGCEALVFEYATATNATTGTYAGRLSTIYAWAWNPATSAMVKTAVAQYAYGESGRLREVHDPRISPNLTTGYTYDSKSRVTVVSPSGEAATTFAYGAGGSQYTGAGDYIDPNPGRLLSVAQASGLGGSVNTTRLMYDVPRTVATGGPYDLGAAALVTWAQVDGPTDATAVFGPQATGLTTYTATASAPGPAGYGLATVHYLNSSAQEVNTAAPAGTGGAVPAAGYIDTAEYDYHGNVIRTLDATNRLLALKALTGAQASLDSWGLGAWSSDQLAQLLDTRMTYSEDGLDLLTQVGPTQKLVVANTGSPVLLRPRVTNTYDQGAPGGAHYHLVTMTVADGVDPFTGVGVDPVATTYGYSPPAGTATSDPSSGWVHKQATSVSVSSPEGTLTSRVLYDARGRAIRSSKPGSELTGTDAGVTSTLFYTAGTHPEEVACGAHPEWAGQPCLTRVAGAVTGHNPATAAATLPVKQVTGYNMWGSPTTVTETAPGPVSRQSVTTYDAADRVLTVAITGTGAGDPVATTRSVYSTTTGDVLKVQSLNAGGSVTASVTRAYDNVGRLTSYTDATGATTATTYDQYGNPATATQVIAGVTTTTTYGYADPRGYLTSITDSVAGTISATWGPDGQLETQALPGGVTLRIGYDPARVPITRTYTRDSDGAVIWTDNVTENHRGQWITHASTTGTATYTYDTVGRLTNVTDLQAGTGGVCTTRAYGFAGNLHSNRTQYATATSATQACPTVSLATTATYDSADRLVSTTSDPAGQTWTYDALGRTTTMPNPGGPITSTFYVNDQIATQTQAGIAQMTWALDPLQRRTTNTQNTWVNGAWAGAATKIAHYANDSDEPSWIAEDATLPTDVTRYVSGVEGDIAVTTSTTGDRVLQLVDLHGDVVGTAPIADGATTITPAGIDLNRTDEFGNPEPLAGEGAINAPPARYGWLGAAQRSAETLGSTILMGVRLYSATTGRFLSVDPVPGGSANAYDYCNADPVNCTDLAGTFPSFASIIKAVAIVGEVASMIPGPIGAAAAGISAVAYAAQGNTSKALEMGITAAAALVGAGAIVKVAAAGFVAFKAGQLAVRAGPRILRAAESAAQLPARINLSAKQAAGRWMSRTLNEGRHRVVVPQRFGRWHFDLAGRPHHGTPAPHAMFQGRNSMAPTGFARPDRRNVEVMTWRQINLARRHLQGRR